VYDFEAYPPQNGGSIHVYQLVENLLGLGCRIHTFDSTINTACRKYAANDEGIKEFVRNIDLLYVRIDGWYISKSPLKLKCMEESKGKVPIVWEINATAQELYKGRHRVTRGKSHRGLLQMMKDIVFNAQLRSRIRKDERLRRRLAEGVDGAVCISEKISKYVVYYLGISNYTVIPNGSDPALFSPEKERSGLFDGYEDSFKVIYIGNSRHPWQGFNYVRSLAQVAKRRADNIVFIALDSSPLASVHREDNLLILPRVNYFDVPAHVASADACLCLYHDLSWTRYGFTGSSLKLFDYMACAKPVIASKLGQISEIVEDGVDGLLTNNDLDDIYDKILICYENRYEAEKLGKRAREKVVRYYNWERVAISTLNVFNSVMRR